MTAIEAIIVDPYFFAWVQQSNQKNIILKLMLKVILLMETEIMMVIFTEKLLCLLDKEMSL